MDILKEILFEECLLDIKTGTDIPSVHISDYAIELIDSLNPVPLFVKVLRGALNENNYKKGL